MARTVFLTLVLQCALAIPASAQMDNQTSEKQIPGERLPLEELLPGQTLQKYRRQQKYHGRLQILRKAFETNAELLGRHIAQRNIADTYRSLAALRGLAFHALDESLQEKNQKEKRHGEVKKLEIRLRKTEENLEDLKLEVPLENRYQFEETNRLLEELREQLLGQLFGQALGSRSEPGMGFLPLTSTAASATVQGLADLDRFTDEEFVMIQLARELDKRVKAFLVIAESRLDEIERRVEGREWEKDDPNPLEFHTYSDMLHAYTRAIDGIMINIDDKAASGMVEEGDLKKSLKMLSSKIEKFIPRLEALKELVIERRDEELGEKLLTAMETSDTARKGAQYGLGAPEREEQ